MRRRDLLTVVVGGIIFASILSKIFPEQASFIIISPLASSVSLASEKILNALSSDELKKIVDESLAETSGTYGIVIKNLKTGETYTQNADRKFETASLYKLWVAATAYKQIESGDLEEDETLSKSIPELNRIFDIDEEFAEQTEGTITRTTDQALDQMITISHNYSALLLTQKLGVSRVTATLKELGLTNSNMGSPPMTTPSDIARFYETLYEGEIVNSETSNKFTEVLKRQELNDRIPKYLPSEVEVAHKTGELGAYKHDAGIIFGKDPILIVMLSETNSQAAAAEREAIIAREVFNYFENK